MVVSQEPVARASQFAVPRNALVRLSLQGNLHAAQIDREHKAHLFAPDLQDDALGIRQPRSLAASCDGEARLCGRIGSTTVPSLALRGRDLYIIEAPRQPRLPWSQSDA